MERGHGGGGSLLVYPLPWGHLNEHVGSPCDNSLNGTVMSSTPIRTFCIHDDNWRASLSRIPVCVQACVSVYLVGAPRSMKWLLLRMQWPSQFDNRITKNPRPLGTHPGAGIWGLNKDGNERSGALQVWGRARQWGFLPLCAAPPPPKGHFIGDTWRRSNNGVPVPKPFSPVY